jgi:anti-sigma factor RsiW
MSTTDHERYEQDVGAYLLGALPALEAEVFERHLMRCEACQEEIERLRRAAEALPRAVEVFEPPPSLRRSLMEVVEAEARTPAPRRARFTWLPRPRLAVALAGITLLTGVALGVVIAAGGDGERTVTATVDRTRLPGGSARVEIDDGTAVLRVSGVPQPPAGKVYEVWVERDGEVRPAGALFGVDRRGSGSAAIPGGVRGVTRVMVTREAGGGVETPTERPVIQVEV